MDILNQMMTKAVQSKMNNIYTKLSQNNPGLYQMLRQISQNKGDMLGVYKEMRNKMSDEQFGALLNTARQMGYPEEVLAQAQQIR